VERNIANDILVMGPNMTKRTNGVSLLLGIVAAFVAAQLVLFATPLISLSSPHLPLIPPTSEYARVGPDGLVKVKSFSSTIQVNVSVVATPKWNMSELVTLHFSRVTAESGGKVTVPPGPYNITFTPSLVQLNASSSVIFNVTLIPWQSAPDIYDQYSDVTFIWWIFCNSYPIENPSSGFNLGSGYLFVVFGQGPTPVP